MEDERFKFQGDTSFALFILSFIDSLNSFACLFIHAHVLQLLFPPQPRRLPIACYFWLSIQTTKTRSLRKLMSFSAMKTKKSHSKRSTSFNTWNVSSRKRCASHRSDLWSFERQWMILRLKRASSYRRERHSYSTSMRCIVRRIFGANTRQYSIPTTSCLKTSRNVIRVLTFHSRLGELFNVNRHSLNCKHKWLILLIFWFHSLIVRAQTKELYWSSICDDINEDNSAHSAEEIQVLYRSEVWRAAIQGCADTEAYWRALGVDREENVKMWKSERSLTHKF